MTFFLNIESDIISFPSEGLVCIGGDTNGRCGNLLDYSPDLFTSSAHCFPSGRPLDEAAIHELISSLRINRTSVDTKVNAYGRDLINFCISSSLLIFNGRGCQPPFNNGFTSFGSRKGQSVVDYFVGSPRLLKFSNMKVHSKFPESDHAPISLRIDTNFNVEACASSQTRKFSWSPLYKYKWSTDDLPLFCEALYYPECTLYRDKLLDEMSSLSSSDRVAEAFMNYVNKAATLAFKYVKCKPPTSDNASGNAWFNDECKSRRLQAISDPSYAKEYKAYLQSAKRNYKQVNISRLEHSLESNPGEIWSVLKEINSKTDITPDGDEMLAYLVKVSQGSKADYFDYDFEAAALQFLNDYDSGIVEPSSDRLLNEALNANLTLPEIDSAIDYLKGGKLPSVDIFHGEFLKAGKPELAPLLLLIYNYLLVLGEFPSRWCEGLTIALFKAGNRLDPSCYRKITILPLFEKVFEICFNRRYDFLKSAFDKIDYHNNGFLKGVRTSDNTFVIQSIIQRQLNLGKPLYVCFVDFSKAFDLVNRNLLFFKLIQSGWSGRVINTLRSLYRQTCFKLRHNGRLSERILEDLGVAQGGSASGNLFRKFLSDASDYINQEYGVVMGHTLIAHLLWADDLVLLAETPRDMQNLLNCLFNFCKRNLMIVNEVKTNCMAFGTLSKPAFFFNGIELVYVDKYKYLGNMISPIVKKTGDIFSNNYDYLCSQARKATFALRAKLKNASPTPPALMLNLFNAKIKPILTFGSELWGLKPQAILKIDTFHRQFLRYILCVKPSTANHYIYGELGCYPLSIELSVFQLCYYHRLHNLKERSLTKYTFDEMLKLSGLGFSSWVTFTWDKISELGLNHLLSLPAKKFKIICREKLEAAFLEDWMAKMASRYSILYNSVKVSFQFEFYLREIKIFNHRRAVSQLRCGSHHLMIEAGRWSRIPRERRLCPSCRVLEDEIHFVNECRINRIERAKLSKYLFSEIFKNSANDFNQFRLNFFVNLLSSNDPLILRALGNFCYHSFNTRNTFLKNSA